METLQGFANVWPYLAHPLVLIGFGLALVVGLYRVMVKMLPSPGPRTGARILNKLVSYTFVLALGIMVLGFGLAFVQATAGPDLYRIDVTVLDPDGTVVTDADFSSSVGCEIRTGIGLYELLIAKASRPADGRVTVRAEKGTMSGKTEITLEDLQQTATVQLIRPQVKLRGLVVDASNRGLSEVRVMVAGSPEGMAITDADGSFELHNPVGAGKFVRLRAEKVGYLVADELVRASDHPLIVMLEQ